MGFTPNPHHYQGANAAFSLRERQPSPLRYPQISHRFVRSGQSIVEYSDHSKNSSFKEHPTSSRIWGSLRSRRKATGEWTDSL